MIPSSFEARRFWRQRHATSDPLRAGGDKGLSPEENYEFYAVRLGTLLQLINRHHLGRRPLSILDAGCGNGILAAELSRCGHRVVGVDFAPEAVDRARQAHPKVRFETSPLEHLERLALEAPFDVVFCVDVLFHIVVDKQWLGALEQLAKHCAANGTLILTDTFADEGYTMSDYIVHRSRRQYTDALASLGFDLLELVPFGYGGNPNQFALFARPGA